MAASPPNVLILGGGFAGLYAAKALRTAPVQITLIDRRNHHLFQPMLYQVATAALSPSNIASPIRSILRRRPGKPRVYAVGEYQPTKETRLPSPLARFIGEVIHLLDPRAHHLVIGAWLDEGCSFEGVEVAVGAEREDAVAGYERRGARAVVEAEVVAVASAVRMLPEFLAV